MSITDIGEILVQQAGAPDGEMTSVGFIGSTTTELDQLVKSLDGGNIKADGTFLRLIKRPDLVKDI